MNRIGEKAMRYQFTLIKNIHMYNHLMQCTDGQNTYSAICESAPTKDPTIIFWPDDFHIPQEDKEIFVSELKLWAFSQKLSCIINSGKGR